LNSNSNRFKSFEFSTASKMALPSLKIWNKNMGLKTSKR
jgi:hypothetical protein